MKRPICGLITDFGNQDYFIGVLKGVMKQICPTVEIIDITNDIPSYNLLAASFALAQSYPFFPCAGIFLVVVDPGVGTSRDMLLAEYGGHWFIAPDNGVLTPILHEEDKTVYRLENNDYFLIRGSSTFEARDKMAPVAAYLAAGVEPSQMGTVTDRYIINPDFFPTIEKKTIKAAIVYVDKFGNLMTNVSAEQLKQASGEAGSDVDFSKAAFTVEIGGRSINRFFSTYGSGGDDVFMLTGSHGNLEIAVNRGSAARLLDVRIGQRLTIRF
ncbi:MAG: SAM-dependent chlorinase/fluorinase [bacterium]|nr:SAM-dependent chlorinase/fluorinase [bacterium]